MSAIDPDSVVSIWGAFTERLDLDPAGRIHARLGLLAAELLDDPSTPAHLRPRLMASVRQSARDLAGSERKTPHNGAAARAEARAIMEALR